MTQKEKSLLKSVVDNLKAGLSARLCFLKL